MDATSLIAAQLFDKTVAQLIVMQLPGDVTVCPVQNVITFLLPVLLSNINFAYLLCLIT